jgi:hypothetical protein
VVLGIVFALFFLIYGIFIRRFTTSVYLPAYCDGTYQPGNVPSNLAYSLPDKSTGVLINSDAGIAAVVTLDDEHAPHPGALFLINKASGNILLQTGFPDDNIAVAIDNSTVYLFNKGIGLFVNKLTGEREDYFLTMDTYGTNELGYFETSGIISSWNKNGFVKSMPHLSFNGILHGCYISGDTKAIIKL